MVKIYNLQLNNFVQLHINAIIHLLDYGQTDSSVNNITEEPKLQSTDEPLMSCEFVLQSTPKR